MTKYNKEEMKCFENYILEELGLEEIDNKALNELCNKLENQVIKKLYSKEYHLLAEDNFKEYYGLESKLLVKTIDCEHCFNIVIYKNISK